MFRRPCAGVEALETGIDLSSTNIPRDGSSDLSAGNFLPGHPVKLLIDGKVVTTLTAGSDGTISYVIKPSDIGLGKGAHTVESKACSSTRTRRST